MNVIDKITKNQIKPDLPDFRVGDTINVGYKIIEGKKERIQWFEGIVIARKGSGVSETFTVRKESYGVGVERIFPINSPMISKIVIVKQGKVRRAKLNFLRNFVGQYRIEERGKK